jgi:hypothetical protein
MDSFISQNKADGRSIARLSTFRRASVKKAHIWQVDMGYPVGIFMNQITGEKNEHVY